MERHFTHYWQAETCRRFAERGRAGERVRCSGGSQFRARRIDDGDVVYIVTLQDGRLSLIGRMEVDGPVRTREEAVDRFGQDVWEAPEYIFAKAETATPMRFDRAVALASTQSLRWLSSAGPIAAKFEAPGRLDRQTLRGLRRLTPASALMFDAILDGEHALWRGLR